MKKVRHCEYSFHSTNREKKKKKKLQMRIKLLAHHTETISRVLFLSFLMDSGALLEEFGLILDMI